MYTAEIEEKVKKILKLIKDEDHEGNGGGPVANSEKETVAKLVEDVTRHSMLSYIIKLRWVIHSSDWSLLLF